MIYLSYFLEENEMSEQSIRNQIEETFYIDDDEDVDTQENKYMLFNIAEEVYGIDIIHVLEIIEVQKITEIPDMPDYIKGVINLRGKIIPVMDMRLRFGMEERSYDDRTCIIIVKVNDTAIGFIVDTVAEVQTITRDNIDPPPQFRSKKMRDKYLKGIGKVGDEVKILLDAEKIIFKEDLNKIAAA